MGKAVVAACSGHHRCDACSSNQETARTGRAFWVSRTLTGNQAEGVSSIAMQQAASGLFLSTLIISVPPMAAMLFQGTLGSFSPYSLFGGRAADSGWPAANGQVGGYPNNGYVPPNAQSALNHADTGNSGAFAGNRTNQSTQPINDSIRTGKN